MKTYIFTLAALANGCSNTTVIIKAPTAKKAAAMLRESDILRIIEVKEGDPEK